MFSNELPSLFSSLKTKMVSGSKYCTAQPNYELPYLSSKGIAKRVVNSCEVEGIDFYSVVKSFLLLIFLYIDRPWMDRNESDRRFSSRSEAADKAFFMLRSSTSNLIVLDINPHREMPDQLFRQSN